MAYEIKIDSREKYTRRQDAIKYYRSIHDNVSVEELAVGDYIFNNKVVFEYKLLPDFVKSVKSGRIYNQDRNQSNNFKYHFIIIVSKYNQRMNYFNKLIYSGQKYLFFDEKMFFDSISRLNTFTTVIQVPNEYEAIRVMRIQAKKCLELEVMGKFNEKSENPAYNWLLSIKSIDRHIVNLIVNHLDLYTLNDIMDLDKSDLLNLDEIDDITAERIMKSIKM